METRIRKTEPQDLAQVIVLMHEFAVFEHLEDSFFVTEANLFDAFFGEKAFAKSLVAFNEEKMVAFAIGFSVLKTFRGERSFYLEDLYITPEFRGQGFGFEMLKAVAKLAKEENCVRMDWQALDWNVKAIEFYKKIGAETDAGNIDFRLIEEKFDELAT
ncbi:MAG TPA: GNAT family N-acetyltransferase [Pyrinomonadaceae bacterium]|nr:GNAT family N-acetyltransferase [Pyrinomonadaceae bacterium]